MIVDAIFCHLGILVAIGLHELGHYMLAKLFGGFPKIRVNKKQGIHVSYQGHLTGLKMAVIAILPNLWLLVIGLMLPSDPMFWGIKGVAYIGLLNLLPIAPDGEVVMLVILKIINERNKL